MEAGDGKHWTKAEIAARKKAAEGIKRSKARSINAPSWLSKEARQIWTRVLASTKGLDLLDNMDTEIFALYCETMAKSKELLVKGSLMEEDTKALQAYSRIALQYADKLGLTPAARSRLVKKKADKIKDDFGSKFD